MWNLLGGDWNSRRCRQDACDSSVTLRCCSIPTVHVEAGLLLRGENSLIRFSAGETQSFPDADKPCF